VSVLLGHDTGDGQEVWLPDSSRSRGVTVIGKTGTGKSTLLEHLILADLRSGTPAVVIDPHGRLASRVAGLAGQDRDRLILLEPWADRPFRLNLLECQDPQDEAAIGRTADHAVETVKKLFDRSDEYQPRLERDLDAAVRLVIPSGGTLLDVLRLFSDPALRAAYRSAVPSGNAVHEYWDYFERLGQTERARQVEATVNRLYRLLASQLIRRIVDTPTTTVPFDRVLHGNQVLLLSLPAPELTPQRCDFLGALFLGALAERVFAREAAHVDPPRLRIYIDEYGRFATPMTTEFFFQGRKFGVDLTVAHQSRDQIRDAESRSAELQAGALLLFQLVGTDAEELAGNLDTTPVRTKLVSRPRMETKTSPPEKREVWSSSEAKAQYEQIQRELAEIEQRPQNAARRLARAKAAYDFLEHAFRYGPNSCDYVYGYGSIPTLVGLLGATGDNAAFHLPFNPSHSSWRSVAREEVSGMRGFGQPDFWAPYLPPDARQYRCEGYGVPRFGLHSSLWSGLYKQQDSLGRYVAEKKYDPLGYDELLEVLKGLESEVAGLLDRQYRLATFWFSPLSGRWGVNYRKGLSVPSKLVADYDRETAWLLGTQPAPGAKRNEAPWGESWTGLGCWQVTAFPQAVGWLKERARTIRSEITTQAISALIAKQSRDTRALEAERLVQSHRRIEEYEETRGEHVVMEETIMPSYDAPGRYPRRAPVIKRETWHDPVLELDQTHADRRLELAGELTHLPAFTAYYRTDVLQHRLLVSPPVSAVANLQVVDSIRQESRRLFGQLPEVPVVVMDSQPESDAPPVRPISRHHPD
jgi:hypothetical protein